VDFSKAKPVSDDIFRVYKEMYAYDRAPLHAKAESVEQDSSDWRREKVTFLPARVSPPYQTVIFFPSSRVMDIPSTDKLGDMKFMDYVVRSGRAVVYPIYKGTYERAAPFPWVDSAAGRGTIIQDSMDLDRTIDYIETRNDIDRNRFAYLGVSLGAAWGVQFAAVEPRLKAG